MNCKECKYFNGTICTDETIWYNDLNDSVCRYQQGARMVKQKEVFSEVIGQSYPEWFSNAILTSNYYCHEAFGKFRTPNERDIQALWNLMKDNISS